MKTHTKITTAVLGAAFMLSAVPALAATPLTASCVGTATPTSITWTASATGGVAPLTYLWGNGSKLATQTVSMPAGTHSTTLQITDASSTVAVATCRTVVAPTNPTASSTAAIDAQIKSIREQIKSLKKQLRELLSQRHSFWKFENYAQSKKSKDLYRGNGRDSDDD